MATIRRPGPGEGTGRGRGWTEIPLAGPDLDPGLPMRARRVVLEPNAAGPALAPPRGETMLYVIRGSGTGTAGAVPMTLEPETVVWLDPADRLTLQAGPEGLEILIGEAELP